MKRIIVAGALAASSFAGIGALAAPAAHADTCNGVAVHVDLNVNGQDTVQDQCIPLSTP